MGAKENCQTCEDRTVHDENGRCTKCGTMKEVPEYKKPHGQPTESGEGDNVPRWTREEGDNQ
jgi:hypothetical protein